MSKLESVLNKISTTAKENILLKITLGNKKNKKDEIKNVFIKPTIIKNELLLSFVYRHLTKDITKNFSLDESMTTLKKLVAESFFNVDVYTSTETIYYTSDKNNKEKITIKVNEDQRKNPTLVHDKQKQRLINSKAFYLQALGITSGEGNVKREMQHKYKQINKYVEIIEGILKDTVFDNDFYVVDMGSGKGYLTFALYDYLQHKNKNIKIQGVELRPDLVIVPRK